MVTKHTNYLEKYNEKKDKSGTGVQFQEYRAPRSYYSGTPKMIKWVMKYSGGYIKDEKQANYVLIGFVVVAIIVTLFLIFGGGGGPNIPLPRGTKIIYPPNGPPRLQEPLAPID